MHRLRGMATQTIDYDLHDHAGARWLAAIAPGILFAVLTGLFMLVYPHL